MASSARLWKPVFTFAPRWPFSRTGLGFQRRVPGGLRELSTQFSPEFYKRTGRIRPGGPRVPFSAARSMLSAMNPLNWQRLGR